MKIDPDQSAFPTDGENQTWGLTKREAIAAMALQGLLANPGVDGAGKDLAIEAIEYADALIDELNALGKSRN